ncbi:hypothetical protein, partial [Rathayibacter iranicus]
MERAWEDALRGVPPRAVTDIEIKVLYDGGKRPISLDVRYKIDGEPDGDNFPNPVQNIDEGTVMNNENSFERLAEIQDEILIFSMEQVGDKVDKFYVQGKITDDSRGNVTGVEGNIRTVIVGGRVLDVSAVLDDAEFYENVAFVRPRITELHDILRILQGKSPVRFRWAVDTTAGTAEGDWTYYDDLSDEEKKDNFWRFWKGDEAWT